MPQNITIFIDESGCLGLSNKSTKHITLACLAIDSNEINHLNKVVFKVKQKLKLPKSEELHASKLTIDRRKKAIKIICKELNKRLSFVEIYSYTLKKQTINSTNLKNDMNAAYNLCVKYALFQMSKMHNSVDIAIDDRTGKTTLPKQTCLYIKENVENHLNNSSVNVNVKKINSSGSAGVQLVDFFSNAIYRSYEQSDNLLLKEVNLKVSDDWGFKKPRY